MLRFFILIQEYVAFPGEEPSGGYAILNYIGEPFRFEHACRWIVLDGHHIPSIDIIFVSKGRYTFDAFCCFETIKSLKVTFSYANSCVGDFHLVLNVLKSFITLKNVYCL